MENINQYGIILDGRLDEPIWETVPTYTNFLTPRIHGAMPCQEQTEFKLLPLGDKLYVGLKCYTDEDTKKLEEDAKASAKTFLTASVEMFFSPSGTGFEYYQFMVSVSGAKDCNYYSEGGFIKPDPYAPEWFAATYIGENYWSVEAQIPLNAFYWTSHTAWNTQWKVNIARIHPSHNPNVGAGISAWSQLDATFMEPGNFRLLDGFPVRAVEDDLCMVSATVDLTEETSSGYLGVMTVDVKCAVADEFVFSSNLSEDQTVALEAGNNIISVPCTVDRLGATQVSLCLTRKGDGKVFKRYYPVFVEFEPIKLCFTLPEYRNNFYPGQDYSKIVGTAKSFKAITLTLEGPGIEPQTITPNADGSFTFDTPDFQEGDAYITATIDSYETRKKISRLAPTGHTMSWISGGNLIVDGKPVLRRDMYAPFYKGGEALNKKYRAENFHLTEFSSVDAQPHWMVPGSEAAGAEATTDGDISDAARAAVDQRIADNRDKDYVYYYISDEPECRGISCIYLRNLYNYIAENDPFHVVLMATRRAGQFVDCADWFETHPYINPSVREDGTRAYERPIHMIGGFVDDIVKRNRSDKCIGFLPSCFAYKWTSDAADYPNFDEMICHTWAAMMRGGKSLWPYAFHDMNDRASVYEGMRYVFATFEALEDLVLLGKRTVLTKTDKVEAVLYDTGDEQMFVLANLVGESQQVTLENLSGTWYHFRHNNMITDNTFNLKPFEVVVGTTCVKDAGLPTYQQVAALIDKIEAERLSNKSLLFQRHNDLSYTASAETQFFYKLFDGTLDNMGWMHAGDKDKFFELDMTKAKVSFQKLTIGGYGLENMKLLVRNGDTLVEPNVAETTTEEFAKTFVFEKPICPDALRMEFTDCKLAELYEIEVF